MADRIRASGCAVVELGMGRGMPSPAAIFRLRQSLRAFRPDIVQGWMYHGNLAAWVGGRIAIPGTPVVWNIRQTLYDLGYERPGTRLVIRAGAHVSRKVVATVYNSEVARQQHLAIGYRTSRSVLIPNGFDLNAFRPSSGARASLRDELGLPGSALIVGLVNRYHPMKGHSTFLRAARSMLDAGIDATFVCAGRDVTLSNPALAELVAGLDLGAHTRLLGERADTARLFAGFDVACMTSAWGEGFPNVVGEAMACGTPCVATDVGDTAAVIGPCGCVVPTNDPGAIAEAVRRLLQLEPEGRGQLGAEARDRIASRYATYLMGSRYACLYRDIVAQVTSIGGQTAIERAAVDRSGA